MRARTRLTQAEFAARIGVPIETVRNWEQGKRSPRGPARALLKVIDKAPQVAFAVLAVKAGALIGTAEQPIVGEAFFLLAVWCYKRRAAAAGAPWQNEFFLDAVNSLIRVPAHPKFRETSNERD